MRGILVSQRLERVGECLRCGACCLDKEVTQPALWASLEVTDNPDIRLQLQPKGDYIAVHRSCSGCTVDADGKTSCTIYLNRPAICQAWPRNRIDLAKTPDCGFSFIMVADDG